jgi:hypothetical protein
MLKNAVVAGWKEAVTLPSLGIPKVIAKLDTGAHSSSLHASQFDFFREHQQSFIRFQAHPSAATSISCQAPLLGYSSVKSSCGSVEQRPVILTIVELSNLVWEIRLTLTARDAMRYRFLLGRQALRQSRCWVDPARTFRLTQRF